MENSNLVGKSFLPEYYIWRSMLSRCYNKKAKDYPRYGGKGITVCNRWRNSFDLFYKDMKARPSVEFTIERKDGSRGYSPENCVWATRKDQARNRISNTKITYHGKSKTLAEWAELFGIRPGTLKHRIDAGWDLEDAFNVSVRGRGKHSWREFKYKGEIRSLFEWSKITGIPVCTIEGRLRLGWSIDKTLSQKKRKWRGR